MINHTFKKHCLPWATRMFASPPFRRVPLLLEMTGAALQSKRGAGYAATWQEIAGALNFITRPSPIVFDVGANVGAWTTYLSLALPEIEKIIMFEPQPSCWPALERICDGKVELVKKAVSDASVTLRFWVNSNSEISSLHEEFGGGAESEEISADGVTIDDFISECRLATVDYVKIDVEGHDLAVIKGARQSIEHGVVKALSFEFGPADLASRTFFRDFWEYLTALNLKIYRLGHDGYAIHIPRYSYDLESFSGVANYVASTHEPKRRR